MSNCSDGDPSTFSHKTACPDYPFLTSCDGSETAAWPITEYCGMTSFFGSQPELPLSAGYIIILGFGLFFSLLTSFMVWLDQRYVGTVMTSERFNTAGRNVKSGLTATVIVSSWTWAATLLQSSTVAYIWGVAGPFWYAAGATIQIFLFGIIAIEIKRKAPTAHTYCEIVLARWGYTAHKVFLYFALMCNMLVCSMLLLGGASVLQALTGMNTTVSSYLIPIGVILYTMLGGLKATFLATYVHTAVIMTLLLVFIFLVYVSSSDLGSVEEVYDNLSTIADLFPVPGNRGGSYLTMQSPGATMFGITNIIGGFSTVFLDQAIWQSAIAANPRSSYEGFLVGGIVWFVIPFGLATSMGLASVALDLPLSYDEVAAGLVPPAVAVHFMGSSGAVAILIMLFMAVTSTGSGILISVSSLFTYDIYKVYINKNANGDDILLWSRVITVVFGLTMGTLSVILNAMGLSLNWVYQFMGILIGGAVFPITCLLLWDRCTSTAAVTGAVTGKILAIMGWLIAAAIYDDNNRITVESTGATEVMLTGNCIGIFSSAIICVVFSYLRPDDPPTYNFKETKAIELIDDSLPKTDETDESLANAKAWITKVGLGFSILTVVVWPVLTIPAGVFSHNFFYFWVVLSIIWASCASLVIILLPLYESWSDLKGVFYGILNYDGEGGKVEECVEGEQVNPVHIELESIPNPAP